MRTALLLTALALAALMAGCAGRPADNSPSPTDTPAARMSLEGRFAYDDMPAFLDIIEPLVTDFFDSRYPELPRPRAITLVPPGRVAASACGAHDQAAYEYCPANAGIFIGQDLLFAFFRIGDAAPAVALAHEWAHHVQSARQLPAPRTARESIAFENQADCIAGAWAAFARDQGWLEYPDDLDDAGALMQAIGSSEGRGRDHGTAAERAGAFDLGFQEGVKGCNRFSPSAPVA